MRGDLPDGPHRQRRAITLIHQRSKEIRDVLMMRIPVPVEAAEARRGQRLIDRRKHLDARITAGNHCRVLGQQLGKFGIEQICVMRAAAMMDEPSDRRDPQTGKPREPGVVPVPIGAVRVVRSHLLPKHRVSQNAKPQFGDGIQVFRSMTVAGLQKLVAEGVVHPGNCALDSAPDFDRWSAETGFRRDSAEIRPRRLAYVAQSANSNSPLLMPFWTGGDRLPRLSSIRRKVASAWPTT